MTHYLDDQPAYTEVRGPVNFDEVRKALATTNASNAPPATGQAESARAVYRAAFAAAVAACLLIASYITY